MLHKCYKEDVLAKAGTAPESIAEQSRNIAAFNARHAGPRSVRQVVEDAPVLLRRLGSDVLRGDGRVIGALLRQALVGYHLLLLCGSILLILVPYDFIPSAAYGLVGYFDDILAGLFLLAYLTALHRCALLALERARHHFAANTA
eukprot:16586-Heterococcus_DN1.PRE.5